MNAARHAVNSAPRCLVIACGALAKEIVRLRAQLDGGEDAFVLQCLPAEFHNAPKKIAPAVEKILKARGKEFDTVLVGYGECGTGGALDRVLERHNATRLPFAHCYEFYAGAALFQKIVDEEIGSFFVTDYLVKNFDRLVIKGLGLDRYPHLLGVYFSNYRRLVYLAQENNSKLTKRARAAAARLELEFDSLYVGYGELGEAIGRVALNDAQTGERRHVLG